MTKQADDLEAVRVLAATLEPFSNEDRDRIIRWARERLGMGAPPQPAAGPPATSVKASSPPDGTTPQTGDIKTFIEQKNPRSDNQLAAVVAYYHQFVASEADRKDSITSEELLDACRKAVRPRPKAPKQTLVNAYTAGLLDRAGPGSYRLNAVGENLVAMVLPGTAGEARERRGARGKRNTKPKAARGRRPRKNATAPARPRSRPSK